MLLLTILNSDQVKKKKKSNTLITMAVLLGHLHSTPRICVRYVFEPDTCQIPGYLANIFNYIFYKLV